ncbi:hypothetical protein [Gloeobacter violaceus]|uniref:Glr0045 protein n=1 Tax=Gloeobacter violaceus (strain ATCC 29082 / PCC 7421) TaxID=251221 RepID=Q7NPL0_GLOVI|nr:hypothetical protein [Gloeobacter violaceus]BAC87986.1 glr0045 [Gloeobacter violaceus PCC 7421]
MKRLLYENSVSHRGFLIVPFRYGAMVGKEIYSYWLLSALAYRSRWHRTENPAGLYSSTLTGIVEIAHEHLDRHGDTPIADDHFARRYVYCDNLIVVCRIGDRIFYDHYLPGGLDNIAAPKLFASETQCLAWIKAGIDRLQVKTGQDSF